MASPVAALLLGLLGQGAGGFVEERRAQEEDVRKEREQARREAETAQNREEQLFQRGVAAEQFVLKGLDVVKDLPLTSRQSAVEAVIAGGKKLGATFTPGLATAFTVNPEAIAKSLRERQLDPSLQGMTEKELKWLTETIEELKQQDARRAAAGPVRGIGTPGAEASARALERGVDPGKAGIAQVPIFPPEGARATSATIRTAVINELNWREAREAAQAAGQPIPAAPAPGEVDTSQLTKEQLIFLAGADDPAVALGQVLRGARAMRPGAERPATPAPSPVERRGGSPAGAGTGGGALPGRSSVAQPSDLPPANLYKNQSLRDPETKKIWRSDGTRWTEVR